MSYKITSAGLGGTDWTSYTPIITHTSGGITNATITGHWRRVGDTMEIEGFISFSAASAVFSGIIFSLPSGTSVDTSKLSSSTADTLMLGSSYYLDSGVSSFMGGVGYQTTTTLSIYNLQTGSGTNPVNVNNAGISNTNPITFGSGDRISWICRVPILGWSSNVTMSNVADVTAVAANYTINTSTLTNNTPITLTMSTKHVDTHNGYSSGTYTIPVAGVYCVSAAMTFADSAGAVTRYIQIQKNGIEIATYNNDNGHSAAASVSYVATAITSCVVGDAITVKGFQNTGGSVSTNGGGTDYFSINRVSDPTTVSAGERMVSKYTTGAGQSIPNAIETILDFGTKEIDTHNAVTTGSAWKFTAPTAGLYRLFGMVTWSGNASGTRYVSIFKNDVDTESLYYFTATDANTISRSGSTVLNLAAGDYVQLKAFQNSGGALTIFNASNYNRIFIERLN